MPSQLPKQLDVIVHIGAGRCEEMDSYLESSAQRIILVEPSPKLAAGLRSRSEKEPRVQVLELAVTNSPVHKQLNEYNLPGTNSLYKATDLKKLFPGLRLLAQQPVTTMTGHELLQHCALTSDQNALIVQAPGMELDIIESLAKTGNLDQFSYLAITCPEQPLYDKASGSATVLIVLQEQGFDLIPADENTDTEWPVWTLHRNALKQKLAEFSLQYEEVLKKLEDTRLELSEYKKTSEYKLMNLQAQLETEQKARTEAEDDLGKYKTYLANRKKQLSDIEEKLWIANKQLEHCSVGLKRFDELDNKLKNLEQNITGHINNKLLNTSKQIEAAMGLNNYLDRGALPLSYHGWPVSPDLALFMAEKIETVNYDLIIEFGSGTSTVLFANSILNRTYRKSYCERDQKRLSSGNFDDDLALITPDENDLPRRVVAFEHSKKYVQETAQLLEQKALEKVVELVHAPLVDYTHEGQDYLYYSCDETLARVARLLDGRSARILVLVDGPPGKTGPMARFPAMPKLLNCLATHMLHIVLDDTKREEEQNISKRWCGLLEKRGLSYTKEILNFEKGAIFIAINE